MHNCGKGKNDHRGRGMEKHTQEGGRPHTIFGTHTQTDTQVVRGSKRGVAQLNKLTLIILQAKSLYVHVFLCNILVTSPYKRIAPSYLEAILCSSAIASFICASFLASASPIRASRFTSAVRAMPRAFINSRLIQDCFVLMILTLRYPSSSLISLRV